MAVAIWPGKLLNSVDPIFRRQNNAAYMNRHYREQMKVGEFVSAHTTEPAVSDQPVFCGISGADQPGREIVAGRFHVDDTPLRWEVSGRCGFAKEFTYRSEG